MERFKVFRGYGKDVLLLTRLSYNVGVGRLLGYGKQGKNKLLCKIEQGDRDFHKDYLSFCHYKGKVLREFVYSLFGLWMSNFAENGYSSICLVVNKVFN